MSATDSRAQSLAPSVPSEEGDRARDASGASRRPIPPLDAATLDRVRARDPEALGLFFERYFDAVYALVHRLLGDHAAAEDAASEVFMKLHRAAHQLDPGRDPTPWLMTIATNVCRDLWRSGAYRMSRRKAAALDDPGVAPRLTSGVNEPERDALTAERDQIVHDALQKLPPQLRTAIVLRDWQGMSHQEIADATGIQHSAARKRYSRALAELAKLLQGRLR
jgi:RNA polymerase sigma-70 factor (ECF subfamily)